MEMYLYRLDWTDKGLFGHLIVDNRVDFVTVERTEKTIPAGRYHVVMYGSPRFKCTVPLLEGVPGRDFIEIHWADWAKQLEGCIAVAHRRSDIENLNADSFAADNNRVAFEDLMTLLKGQSDIWITIK
jgi:hypothetical protein